MTEETNSLSNDAAPAAPAPSSLRQAREAAGLPVATLAAMLKVPVERLQALEDGRYQELPNLTFARALASSVCRALKIDPVPLLQSLPQAAEVKLGSDRPLEPATFAERRMPLASAAASFPLRSPLLWALVVLVIAAALWWWLPQKGSLLPESQPAATAAPAASVVETVPAPGVVEQPQGVAAPPAQTAPVVPAPATPEPAPAAVGSPQSSVVPAPGVAQLAAAVAPASVAAAADQPLLRLSASQPVWVKVSGASNKQLLQRTLQSGETVDLSEGAPYVVVVGRAGAVRVAVRGEALDLSSYARNKVARFEVK